MITPIREMNDALDASLEMPKQYGSRGLWRYRQVSALIGLVTIPVLLLLNLVAVPAAYQNAAGVAGFAFIAIVAIFFIRRDSRVQRRVDDTGSPLTDREPY